MGRVKEFALWLAESVYLLGMSDEAIISACRLQDMDADNINRKQWIKAQIDVVRDNPQIYEAMTR